MQFLVLESLQVWDDFLNTEKLCSTVFCTLEQMLVNNPHVQQEFKSLNLNFSEK